MDNNEDNISVASYHTPAESPPQPSVYHTPPESPPQPSEYHTPPESPPQPSVYHTPPESPRPHDGHADHVVPVSIWTDEKWAKQFINLQIGGAVSVGIPVALITFGLLGTKAFSIAANCNPNKHVSQLVLFEGSASMFFLLISAIVSIVGLANFVNRLTAVQIAQERWRLSVGFLVCTLLQVAGSTFLGLAFMEFVQIRLGDWSCGSTYVQTMVILFSFWIVAFAYFSYHCVRGVFLTA